ncbi:flavin oxidoreductase [Amylibacter kogurei]|uniref:Flavin oxidoreductase n=1 Tax=Paramylibacter kogurei TaxID=1889778 RepID=A0A2G5KAH8_9RHOB|nr:flavin reductase family protein [Amylibacter kogurei]PIB25644.1 flavin oxidoreductase [Amylibacter kogurei]
MADGGGNMTTRFTPDPENTRLLRNAFGRFATGVTVITCDGVDGPVGITANSFSSVSLDPALVLWAPAKSSRRFAYFSAAQHYAIHILDVEQADICNGFVKSAHAFDGLDYIVNAHNVPLIENCLARFECTRVNNYDGGDHEIILGQVTNAEMRDGDALAFYAGRMGGLPQHV